MKIIEKKKEWKKSKFSGVIVSQQGVLHKFDSILLQTSNDEVVDCFTHELTLTSNRFKVKVER